jgi:hypothetical protein
MRTLKFLLKRAYKVGKVDHFESPEYVGRGNRFVLLLL